MEQNYFELPARDEDAPCGPLSRSMSMTDSFAEPPTPASGPSTPGHFPLMMGQDNTEYKKIRMGVTPPGSDLGTSFSSEAPQYLDFGFSAYPQQLVSPPAEYVTQQYSGDAFNQYNAMQAWVWPQDTAPMFFEPNTPGVAINPGEPMNHRPYCSVQERTAALHRVQNGRKTSRRAKMPIAMVERRTVTKADAEQAVLNQSGKYICSVAGCGRQYKRREHLKRHFNIKHGNCVWSFCPFCTGSSSRVDNFRGHVLLHTTKEGRVPFHPDAKKLLDKLEAEKKSRTKKAGIRAAQEARIKAEL
ncbi:hypothetical protein GGR55DRAFT_680519 [Xylaria sp. FL0064]|nr:hypothetical protein GGR55DRAFT_680519 [Xylaria sp. FL0064]